MAGLRERLAEAVALHFEQGGADTALASAMAKIVAGKAQFDALGRSIGTPVLALIEETARENADLLAFNTKPANTTSDTRTAYERDVEHARSAAAANRQARIDALKAEGNPWQRGTVNLTRQGLLTNLAPDLAARLQTEARA